MPTFGSQPQAWALIGLMSGAEVYGILPVAAAGRVLDYLNSDIEGVITITRATTEDVQGGEVPDLLVQISQVTYVQPVGTADAPPVSASVRNRGYQEVEVSLVLRTRVTISGIAQVPPGLELSALLGRTTESFLPFSRAVLSTSSGESRQAHGVLVNKEHIMLARRLG